MQLGQNGVPFRVHSGGDRSAAPGLPRARAPPGGPRARNRAPESRGIPGSPRPAQSQKRPLRRSRVCESKPGRPGADLAERPRAAPPPRAASPCSLGLTPGARGVGGVLASEARRPRWPARLLTSCLSRGAGGTVAGGSRPEPRPAFRGGRASPGRRKRPARARAAPGRAGKGKSP